MPVQQQEIEFSDLLNRNSQTINSICLRYCGGNAFYFDELWQECAVAIWAEFSRYGLDRFRGDSAESTWIYQISYHAVINYLRNPHHQEFQSVCNLHEHPTDGQARDDWHLFDELTTQLNHSERIMLNHFLNDDSYTTIARNENITKSNARKRMSRLLNKLKMLIHK